MGDGANVLMIDEPRTESGIYLYTHSRGFEWPERLRLALLEAEPRWTDAQYGSRIVVTSMFRDLDGGVTGGGISTILGDNSRPVIVVNWVTQTVTIDMSAWGFGAYAALPYADWPS